MHRRRFAPPAGNCVIVLACLCSACGRGAPRSFPDTTGQTRTSHRASAGEPTSPPRTSSQPSALLQDSGGSESEGDPYLFDRVIALCIGIEKYRHVDETPFAEADAQAVGELLHDRYGFTADVTLLGSKATKAAILGKLDEYAKSLGERDCFILFFAGHGEVINLPLEAGRAPAREGFLIPHEAQLILKDHRDPAAWRREAIGMHDIVGRLQGMKTRHALAVVDACCSGFMTMRGDSFKARYDLRYYLVNPSRAVLAATTDDQPATPDETRGHGRFTAALLDELTDWADVRQEAASLTDVFLGVSSRIRKDSTENESSARSVMIPMMNTRLGDGSGEFVFIPKSVRQSDIDHVAQLISREAPAVDGRGNALSGAVGRAQERENLKTTEGEVIAAYDALDYRFGTSAAKEAARWKTLLDRYLWQAISGDPFAMAALHYCYRHGLGTERDPQKAYRWAVQAYESGLPAGKHVLGDCYANGIGVPKNELAADELFHEAARGGFPISKLVVVTPTLEKIGAEARGKTVRFEEGELERLREGLSFATEAGVNRARRSLSTLYLKGNGGFQRDPAKAIRLLEETARDDPGSVGSAFAGVTLSLWLREGIPGHLEPDPERAVSELQRAASAGFELAQIQLANDYYFGNDVPVDYAMAFRWADLAFRQNEVVIGRGADAAPILYELYSRGRGVPQDMEKARRCLEDGAKAGSAEANRMLGAILLEEEEPAKGLPYLVRAGELGDRGGWYLAGRYYANQYLDKMSKAARTRALERGPARNPEESMRNFNSELKEFEHSKRRIAFDEQAQKAAYYFLKAARMGHEMAEAELSVAGQGRFSHPDLRRWAEYLIEVEDGVRDRRDAPLMFPDGWDETPDWIRRQSR